MMEVNDLNIYCQSADYYREIINQARDIILILLMDGTIIDANKAAEEAYGYNLIELKTLTIQDLRPNTTRSLTSDQLQTAFAKGILFETIHYRKDKSHFPVEVSSHRIMIGQDYGLVSIIRDITQRVQVSEALNHESQLVHKHEVLFKNRYEAIAAGVIVQDITGKIIYANPVAAMILGISTDELLGKVSADPIWMAIDANGNPLPPVKHPITITLKTGAVVADFIHGISNKTTGEVRWLLMTSKPIWDKDNNQMLEAIVTFIDITKLRTTQTALQESEEQFRSLFSTMAEGVALHELILDAVGIPCNYRIIEVNTSYEMILGLRREDIIGKLATEAYNVMQAPYLKEYSEVTIKEITLRMETYFKPLDKHFIISVTSWGKNKFATIFSDVTELTNAHNKLIAKNIELEELASTDRLTGIWNRRYFEKSIATELAKAQRYHQHLSLIIFDIDHFKYINDHYGHQIGDKALIEVSHLIQENIRENDVLARWGGDEFIILLPCLSANSAMEVADKLKLLIGNCKFSQFPALTISMGVAELLTEETMWSLIKRTDDALYAAKEGGRNAIRLADSTKLSL